MQKIGVVGAGAMGRGIAQVAAQAGHAVVISDTQEAMLKEASDDLTKILNRLVEKGKIDQATANTTIANITYTQNPEDFAECSLVIEAIVERVDIKKQVFSTLETIVSEHCILASNTSSLSVASLAAAVEHAERVIGIHFFNPAPLMPLVEIIPAVQTAENTTKTATKLIESWGKIPVIAKDTPGFIVNRVARPFYGEALRILEEGIADTPTIDWAMRSLGGFRMGPFELMDFIGNDINYAVTASVFEAFYYDPRYKPSFTQKRLTEAGWYGRKSGRGHYDYRPGAKQAPPTEDGILGRTIVNRILVMLINEAADALYLNIAGKADIDLAMTKGVNYPKGLLVWADEIGIGECVKMMDTLHDTYLEERYRCSPLLRKMQKEGLSFFPNSKNHGATN